MRSSIVLFALCAALVGTHALPAPGYAPSSLVHLNRRAPVDNTPPVSTGPQKVTITVTNPDTSRTPPSTPRQPTTGGSQSAPTTPRTTTDTSTGGRTQSQSAPTTPRRTSPEKAGNYYSYQYYNANSAYYYSASTYYSTTSTTGSGSTPPGSPRASGDAPTQLIIYLDRFDPPKALPTVATLQAAGFGSEMKETGNKGIGNYVKVRSLGTGTFSKVFLVYKTTDKQFYALKLQGWEFSYRPEEFAILKILTEKNLVNVVKVVEEINEPDRKGFVLEPANGGDVGELIKQTTTGLKESVAKAVFEQLVKGLIDMHALDITVRDIKPSNVLIFKNGGTTTYKYADFGMAGKEGEPYPEVYHWRDVSGPPRKIRLNGDRRYLAPEVAAGTYTSFKPVDVFALGCTLYEMLSKPGVNYVTLDATGRFSGLGDLTALSQAYPDAAGLIKVMTAVDPTARPTAAALLDMLKTWVPKS